MHNLAKIPIAAYPLEFAADYLSRLSKDFQRILILLPNPQSKLALLNTINKRNAVNPLGKGIPRVTTLSELCQTTATKANVLTTGQAYLLLLNALQNETHPYQDTNLWQLADNLLKLFSELTLQQIPLPDNLTALQQFLQNAYQLPNSVTNLLSREASIVYTLWQAWQTQLTANQQLDGSLYYIQQLTSLVTELPQRWQCLLTLGCNFSYQVEQNWLARLSQHMPVHELQIATIFASASAPATSFLSRYADHAGAPLIERLQQQQHDSATSPIHDQIRLLACDALQQEVECIRTAIQQALAKQQQRIGIITENRMLARRLRAVLARDGLILQDSVGWALSTTRMASLLENWLECIEGDFPQQALLELLKSPALHTATEMNFSKLIYRLEHDIIGHEKIASGIRRYQQAIHYRLIRLHKQESAEYQALQELLQQYQSIAEPLMQNLQQTLTLSTWLNYLLSGLQQLKLPEFWLNDPAGTQLWQLLLELQGSLAKQNDVQLNWSELRQYLHRLLENQYFIPPANASDIQLLTLEQSQLLQFERIIIASADPQHLPKAAPREIFFNAAVRQALGLTSVHAHTALQEKYWLQLLCRHTDILITWQQLSAQGEPQAASNWVQGLLQFHQACYGTSLIDHTLLQQSNALHHKIITPAKCAQQPQPVVAITDIPQKISVSAHQQLIDCPYQFYVNHILQLRAREPISLLLQKSDYGERVHLCLQAFHSAVKGLPQAFAQPLNLQNRTAAIDKLTEISKAVFAQDLEDNFEHRGWLKRWLVQIPHYIDWQINHNQDWQIRATEQTYNTVLMDHYQLTGRIDRIDQQQAERMIIDYKTGELPTQSEVDQGEAVQLSSYALLLDHVSQVQYLGLGSKTKIQSNIKLSKTALPTVSAAARERLTRILTAISQQAPLPAWPHEATCKNCAASVICRKNQWH